MIKVKIFHLETGRKIPKELKSLLTKQIKKYASSVGEILKIPVINFTVYSNKDWCIPQTHDGGYTAAPDWIQIFIDPSAKDKLIKQAINKFVPATICHEMHHAKRMSGVGYGDNLLEVAISEGLATIFAEEIITGYIAPWGKYTDKEIKPLLEMFLAGLTVKKYNHAEWFFGEGKPYWLGYKVGAYLIRSIKQKSPNLNCINMVNISGRQLFKKYRFGLLSI